MRLSLSLYKKYVPKRPRPKDRTTTELPPVSYVYTRELPPNKTELRPNQREPHATRELRAWSRVRFGTDLTPELRSAPLWLEGRKFK